MSIDEIGIFRDAAPEVASYDPFAKARVRARLVNGEAPAHRPHLVRRRFLTVGALTLALGAGITAVQNVEFGGGGDLKITPTGAVKAPKRVLGPVADAADFADRAAAQAATEPAWTIRPDQWSYVKNLLASSSKGNGGALFGPPDRRMTSEHWSSADGKKAAFFVNGKLEVTQQPEVTPRSDYPFLLALPTDPVALRNFVFEQVRAESPGRRPNEDDLAARAFQVIEVWMRGLALPPAIRAALYGVVAKLPGVKYEAKAADLAGRKGVTLYRIEEGYLRREIMVDPVTYEYLGFRSIAIKNHVSKGLDRDLHSKKGQILGWGALLKTATVDKAGQRP
jgi:hypothetical protein